MNRCLAGTRLTLYGIYKWNPELFSSAPMPSGVQAPALIHALMRKHGAQYPYQQDGDELKISIDEWFAWMKPAYDRISTALDAEYNPIENYDRHEKNIRDYQDRGSDSGTSSSNTEGSSDTDTMTNRQNQVSAFDSDNYHPESMEDMKGSSNTTTTDTATSTSTTNYGRGRKEDEEIHVHGNIGVTTNQEMIKQEINLRLENQLIAIICRDFEAEFLSRVY